MGSRGRYTASPGHQDVQVASPDHPGAVYRSVPAPRDSVPLSFQISKFSYLNRSAGPYIFNATNIIFGRNSHLMIDNIEYRSNT